MCKPSGQQLAYLTPCCEAILATKMLPAETAVRTRGRTRCNTCVHTNASPTINIPGGHITINSKYSCTSNNVVYVIKCRACDKVYIGKTGRRLGYRFREHLRSTRVANTHLPIGRHIVSSNHSTDDMLVSVVCTGFRDAAERRRFEGRMIFGHHMLHPRGLNTDFAFI